VKGRTSRGHSTMWTNALTVHPRRAVQYGRGAHACITTSRSGMQLAAAALISVSMRDQFIETGSRLGLITAIVQFPSELVWDGPGPSVNRIRGSTKVKSINNLPVPVLAKASRSVGMIRKVTGRVSINVVKV